MNALLTLATVLLSLSVARAEEVPCSPVSEFVDPQETSLDPAFCREWNPEFQHWGFRCCPKTLTRGRRGGVRCSPKRVKYTYCDEMTDDQRQYTMDVATGRVGDVLGNIENTLGENLEQSFCGVNNGFLAFGRRIIPTELNRIAMRAPTRCVDFGTDRMVGMLEWLGRQVAAQYNDPDYKGVKLVLGDVSAPRGGCLSGKRGRRGHASHTSGIDVDIGFLTPQKHRASPVSFHKQFDPEVNAWMISKLFSNPLTCVKRIFLDRTLIAKLNRKLKDSSDWLAVRRFVQHMPGHRNHMHVRIGNHPGAPGCLEPETNTPDEEEDGAISEDRSLAQD